MARAKIGAKEEFLLQQHTAKDGLHSKTAASSAVMGPPCRASVDLEHWLSLS